MELEISKGFIVLVVLFVAAAIYHEALWTYILYALTQVQVFPLVERNPIIATLELLFALALVLGGIYILIVFVRRLLEDD